MSDVTPEQRLAELESKYAEAQTALEETRKQLETTERRGEIDRLLMEADAVDLGAARLLTEVAVASMDEKDVAAAVEELRRGKPYLFRRQPASRGGGAMAGKSRRGSATLDDAAERAVETGNRRDLLEYLRMRRGMRS